MKKIDQKQRYSIISFDRVAKNRNSTVYELFNNIFSRHNRRLQDEEGL